MLKAFLFFLTLFFAVTFLAPSARSENYGSPQYRRRDGDGRGGDNRESDRFNHRIGPIIRGHGNGRIERPARFNLGPAPHGGWRGNTYYWGGYTYYVWGWGPYAPFYAWPHYYGWHLGLYYYVPEGLRCFSDNRETPGDWVGKEAYYSSDDAINSALGYCENDGRVKEAHAESACRIRECVEW